MPDMEKKVSLSLPEDIHQKLEEEDDNIDDLVPELLYDYYRIKEMPKCQGCTDRISRYDDNVLIKESGDQTVAFCTQCLEDEVVRDSESSEWTARAQKSTSGLIKRFIENVVFMYVIVRSGLGDLIEGSSTNERKQTSGKTLYPNKEDIEFDPSKYDTPEKIPVEGRPESDINCEYEISIDEQGSTTVEGKIRNNSDRHIDFVDIRVVYFADDIRIGAGLASVESIDVNETKEWKNFQAADVLGGPPTHVEVILEPKDKSNN